MSPRLRPGGYGHRIQRLGADTFVVSWTYDVKYRRIRYPRTMRRTTDLRGAERFAKRWGLPVPEAPPV
jgi:hypothetical protein